MTYTAPDIVLILGGVGTLGAQLIVAWRTSTKVDTVIEKTKDIHAVAETIHIATNSAATAAVALNTSLQQQNQILRDQLAAQRATAELLAQGVQARDQTRLVSDALHATPEGKP